MIPLYVGGCFGIFHPAEGRHAALICGALGDEALNAYRPLVLLAGQLAAAGIPVLRLNYYGTADSAGEDGEPGRFQQWIDGIRAGIDWLRSECGAETVTVIGHRVGASLAAHAACGIGGVDDLVLLAPISGRQFVHELTLAARISQRVWQTTHKIDDGTWFEAAGLRIDHPTRDALNALDLRKVPSRPAARALVIEGAGRPAPAAVLDALRKQGTEVAFEAHAGLAHMLLDSFVAKMPQSVSESIIRWTGPPNAAGAPTSAPRRNAGASLAVGVGREEPVYFGPDEQLFGILTMPEHLSARGPAILMVNTSANPRWGNSRIGTDLARTLAQDGLASMRMDARGMGDSAPPAGEVGQPYQQPVTEDALHAAVELERRTGRPVVLLGFCSGAYHVLHAAFHDPAVHGLMLVNLQRFQWREGDPADEQRRSDLRPTLFYVRNLLSAQAWWRLVRGDFDAVNLVRVLALRILHRGLAGIDPLLGAFVGSATRVGRVRVAMQELARRSVPVLYVLGHNDPGVEELASHFGTGGWRLRRMPNVTMHILENTDHTIAAASVRETLIRYIRDWCHDTWSTPSVGAASGGWAAQRVLVHGRTMQGAHRSPLGMLFRRTSLPR